MQSALKSGASYVLILVVLTDIKPTLWGTPRSKLGQIVLVRLWLATMSHHLMGCRSVTATAVRILAEEYVLCFNIML